MLPVTFGALDGEATWRAEEGVEVGPHRLAAPYPTETTRPALFTALRTGFAEALLREAFLAVRDLRARRRQERGLAPGEAALGLGKLLVVAPDQEHAKRYLEIVRALDSGRPGRGSWRSWRPPTRRGAHEAVAAFRLQPEPSILVTVAMAYEGLDVPEVAVVAALTHIRSRPWLEQMVARATRVDPNAGPYETQRALVFHPDDPLFQRFRIRMETEQGTLARPPKPGRQANPPALLGAGGARAGEGRHRPAREQRARAALQHAAAGPGPGDATPGAGGGAIGAARGAVGDRAAAARPAGRAGGGAGRRGRGRPRGAPRRRRRTRPVSPLQRRAEARLRRQEPGADDAVRAGSGDRLARAQPAVRAPAPARGRSPLRLVRPQAPRMEAAGRPLDLPPTPSGAALSRHARSLGAGKSFGKDAGSALSHRQSRWTRKMALHLFDVRDRAPNISPLTISDRLIALAQDADRAGFVRTASRIIDLALSVLDDEQPGALAA